MKNKKPFTPALLEIFDFGRSADVITASQIGTEIDGWGEEFTPTGTHNDVYSEVRQ